MCIQCRVKSVIFRTLAFSCCMFNGREKCNFVLQFLVNGAFTWLLQVLLVDITYWVCPCCMLVYWFLHIFVSFLPEFKAIIYILHIHIPNKRNVDSSACPEVKNDKIYDFFEITKIPQKCCCVNYLLIFFKPRVKRQNLNVQIKKAWIF